MVGEINERLFWIATSHEQMTISVGAQEHLVDEYNTGVAFSIFHWLK